MELSGVVIMVLVLGGVWGGFLYLVYQTVRKDKD